MSADSTECPECREIFESPAGMKIHHGRMHDAPLPGLDEMTLRRLYIDERLPLNKISKEVGHDRVAISRTMKEYGIELRVPAEMNKERARETPPSFSTGKQGYERWFNEGEMVLVHRLLAVAEYGFDAVRGKVVHHGKEGGDFPPVEIPWANWGGNIEVMTAGEHTTHHNQGATRADLLSALNRLGDALGRAPKMKEMNGEGEYHVEAYLREFGTWNTAVETAGYEPRQRGGWGISRADLLSEIHRLADDLGHVPSGVEMNEQGQYNKITYWREFGSWTSAVETAGYEPRY